MPIRQLQFRGGARIGIFSITSPIAVLDVYESHLSIAVPFSRKDIDFNAIKQINEIDFLFGCVFRFDFEEDSNLKPFYFWPKRSQREDFKKWVTGLRQTQQV